MIANINRKRILDFKFNKNHYQSGIYNGVKWLLLKKKQISNNLYKYSFLITVYNNQGGSISGNKMLITDDIETWYAARVVLSETDPDYDHFS